MLAFQQSELMFVFHVFGDDTQLKAVRHGDIRRDNRERVARCTGWLSD